MNSFRVIDTRFRILKGGKIGLSLSISLIGSALVFGNINAYSQTFFDRAPLLPGGLHYRASFGLVLLSTHR